MRWQGEGGGQKSTKIEATSFMDGPLVRIEARNRSRGWLDDEFNDGFSFTAKGTLSEDTIRSFLRQLGEYLYLYFQGLFHRTNFGQGFQGCKLQSKTIT